MISNGSCTPPSPVREFSYFSGLFSSAYEAGSIRIYEFKSTSEDDAWITFIAKSSYTGKEVAVRSKWSRFPVRQPLIVEKLDDLERIALELRRPIIRM